ncbi:hypothetical protein [Halogeometricum sp. CBA1124]|uniref:hypothetical protein n=1 Tax=Halogeometricum sp. CBA1124 TaxID=2668071 RepID=UPI00142D0FC3|nr:hypothetical protein [Halogeometricum sp. CBA1124]MUV57784.1 hypothetical protein [Halogeometricum sp. CBA1124]
MTDTETELGDAFEEATTAAESADAEREDGSLPGEERESLRESTERLASAVSSASVADLLDAAGVRRRPGRRLAG